MPDTIALEIPIDKSPVPAALDVYYDFVKALAVPGPGDRVGIFGTITNYDINAQAPLYNDYVVRAFADRTTRTSPIASQGLGDFAERYSARYLDMLKLLVAALDSSVPEAAQEQIERHRSTIREVSRQRDTWLAAFEDSWSKEMERLGIDRTKIDSDLNVQQRYFNEGVIFRKQRRYAETLREYIDTLIQEEMAIEAIRLGSYPDDEARQLVNLLKQANAFNTTRPRRPDLEIKNHWDELTIEDPRFKDMQDIFDIGPAIESIVDPRVILNGSGSRGYSVQTTSTKTDNHDKDWGVSGSASYGFFLKANFETNNASNFASTVTKVRQVSVNFAHLGMLDVSRGGWFSSQIFGFKRVKDFLKRDQVLVRKLALLSTSLIIGRGLTLKLFFKDTSDVREWGNTSISGGGGFTILGLNFGPRGSSSSHWERRTIDEHEQSVTFTDDPNVCRLLGVKVTPVIDAPPAFLALGAKPISRIPTLSEAASKALDGEVRSIEQNALLEAALGRKVTDLF